MSYSLWILTSFAAFLGGSLLAMRSRLSLDPNLNEEGDVIGYHGMWRPAAWFLLGTIGCIAINGLSVWLQPSLKPVPAAAFQNFKGCSPPFLDENDPRFLSASCVDYHYELAEDYAYKVGLPVQGRGNQWYRVGNDAFLVIRAGYRILQHRPTVFYQLEDRAKPQHQVD